MIGHLIVSKEEPGPRILGSIYFRNGKVLSVDRPIGEDAYIPWNEDALGFARTLYRAIAPTSGESQTTAVVTVSSAITQNRPIVIT